MTLVTSYGKLWHFLRNRLKTYTCCNEHWVKVPELFYGNLLYNKIAIFDLEVFYNSSKVDKHMLCSNIDMKSLISVYERGLEG